MKFKRDFLQSIVGDGECKLVDTSRWSKIYEQVFEHEGKHYETSYSLGATEQQDERPYENDPEEIECHEVRQVEKVVKVWERIPA